MEKIKKAVLKIEEVEGRVSVTLGLRLRKNRQQRKIKITQEEVKSFLVQKGYKIIKSLQETSFYSNCSEEHKDEVVWEFLLEKKTKHISKKENIQEKSCSY